MERYWRYYATPVASVMLVVLVAVAAGILTYRISLGESFGELQLPITLLICCAAALLLSWMKIINRIVKRWEGEAK